MPQVLGKLIVAGNMVSFEFDKAVTKIPNDYAETIICFDADKKLNTPITYQQFKWSIIKREDKIGVRFRDLKNPALYTFKGKAKNPIQQIAYTAFEADGTPIIDDDYIRRSLDAQEKAATAALH
jgi:hypothetical protein